MTNDDIKQIGEVFKSKRKEMNLSLKEVENSTSIRSGYLEAIEEGRIGQFIANVYATGFIKQYAAFLGIDVAVLMQRHPRIFRPNPEAHEFDYGIGTLEMRGSGMSGGRASQSRFSGVAGLAMWIGIIAVTVLSVWLVMRRLGIF